MGLGSFGNMAVYNRLGCPPRLAGAENIGFSSAGVVSTYSIVKELRRGVGAAGSPASYRKIPGFTWKRSPSFFACGPLMGRLPFSAS
jgi:hypothetical protein